MSDIGAYCRDVEAYLMRANGGHLIRIVGPAFSMVRQWAEEGIPLSAVCRAIDQKAERHRRGTSRRPLRIEFCESDVREVYETWRRAIGATAGEAAPEAGATREGLGSGPARKSTTRDLERAIDRLVAVAGRLDLPEAFRRGAQSLLDEVITIRDAVKGMRGEGRAKTIAPLGALDRRLLELARQTAGPALSAIHAQAEADLAPYRDRLGREQWTHAVEVTVDRGVRTHFGLPDLAAIASGEEAS